MKAEIKKRLAAIKRGEVPAGYITHFGTSPESWKRYKLHEICRKVTKKNVGNSIKTVLTNSAANGVVLQNNYFEKNIANDENTENYFIVENKDFIYNPRISANAAYGPINPNELNITGIVSPLYTVFRQTNSENVIHEYLKHFFSSYQWHEYIYSIGNYGVRFDRINILDEDFFNMPIIIPPLSEQKKIVEILSCCDQLIALKEKLLEEKRRQKKWMLEKLMNPDSGVRLPGFKGKWEEKRLGDICYTNMSTLNENTTPNYKFYYLDISSVDNGNITLPKERVSFENAPVRARKLFNKGDVLVSTVRPYLHGFAFIDFDSKEFVASTGFCVLSAKESILPKFIYHQLYTKKLDIQYNNCLVGTNYPAINSSDLDQFLFDVPIELKEQEAIANILFQADNGIALLGKELAKWRLAKKALMQVLLTGIVRV